MRKQNPSRHQQQGVSLRIFAEQTGIREGQLLHYIRKGQILGARKHPLTKKWWIYPPAKLLLGGAARSPSAAVGNKVLDAARRPRTVVAFETAGPLTVDGVSPGVLPSVFAAPGLREAVRDIARAAAETHYPLVLSASQMVLVEQAVSDAVDEAIQAMSDEPHGRDEIKPYVDAYNQLYRVFRAAKAAKTTPNENWRGGEL